MIPLLGVGRDLFAAEPLDGLPDHFVLFSEVRDIPVFASQLPSSNIAH